jgi:hypothetical protein
MHPEWARNEVFGGLRRGLQSTRSWPKGEEGTHTKPNRNYSPQGLEEVCSKGIKNPNGLGDFVGSTR